MMRMHLGSARAMYVYVVGQVRTAYYATNFPSLYPLFLLLLLPAADQFWLFIVTGVRAQQERSLGIGCAAAGVSGLVLTPLTPLLGQAFSGSSFLWVKLSLGRQVWAYWVPVPPTQEVGVDSIRSLLAHSFLRCHTLQVFWAFSFVRSVIAHTGEWSACPTGTSVR